MSAVDSPNIVLLVMDTARAATVLSDGSPEYPVLSSLAGEGANYTAAFADAAWTLPSHASLFTGTSPSKHGAHAAHKHLDGSLRTLPETLSDAGYRTVGVTNNAWVTDEFGLERGFDDYRRAWQLRQSDVDVGPLAMAPGDGGVDREVVGRLLFEGNPLINLANALYGKFLYRRTDFGARRTNGIVRDLIDEDSDPFFLFVNYLEPHLEYDPPEPFANEFVPGSTDEASSLPQDPWGYLCGEVELGSADFETLRALYTGEIAYLDYRIGEVVDYLREIEQWEETILVVVGDHGENIGEHGLMDHQYCLYDTVLHVPLVVTGGPFDGLGQRDELVAISDIFPTVVDVLDVDDDRLDDQFQGQSFAPTDGGTDRDIVVSEYKAPQPSLETLEERYGPLPEEVRAFDRRLRAVRTRDSKLIRGSDGSRELFDLCQDPEETSNVAGERLNEVERLASRLDDWLESFEHATADESVTIDSGVRNQLRDLGYL